MPINSAYILLASMDVAPDAEATFHDVYDREHVPFLSEVPGVLSIVRFEAQDFHMAIGGDERAIPLGSNPRHTAVYELAGPEVLVSTEWAAAVERGRWPGEVRPHTTNRRHTLLRRLGP